MDKKIISLVQRLMSFDETNATIEEVAVASSKIRTILEKHQLTMADVTGSIKEGVEYIKIDASERISTWRKSLLLNICKSFDCESFVKKLRGQQSFVIIGMESDAKIAEYFYAVLSRVLYESGQKKGRALGLKAGKLRKYVSCFITGASCEIYKRFLDSRNTASSDTTALVRRKKNDIQAYMAQFNIRIGRKSQTTYTDPVSMCGLMDGRQEGETIHLTKGISSKGVPTNMLVG